MSVHARLTLEREGFDLDLDLRLPGQGVSGVYGPSGSGKTTLLRSLAGLEPRARGRVQVGEAIWQDTDAGVFVPTHRRGVGYVFQDAGLFPQLSVRGNLEFARRRAPSERLDRDQVVALTGVAHLLSRSPQGLSGGERQRVALARALLAAPEMLLLDEPMASLDRTSRLELLPYLEALHDALGIPMVYVSHAAREIARLADHVLVLDAGRVRASGTVQEVFTRLEVAGERGAGGLAVILAVVAGHEPEHHLTRLRFDGGELVLPEQRLAVGQPVRLLIHPRDISLTMTRAHDTSILNILPVTVAASIAHGPSQLLVSLSAGATTLLAQITRRSGELLNVHEGQRLFAQIKGVSLLS
jgi:molybdate transport system ATP-binding protein